MLPLLVNSVAKVSVHGRANTYLSVPSIWLQISKRSVTTASSISHGSDAGITATTGDAEQLAQAGPTATPRAEAGAPELQTPLDGDTSPATSKRRLSRPSMSRFARLPERWERLRLAWSVRGSVPATAPSAREVVDLNRKLESLRAKRT